jgi:hypothetical protein
VETAEVKDAQTIDVAQDGLNIVVTL